MLRLLFHLLLVKPLVSIILGLNVRNREHLPIKGPAIIVANHNSHLDTLALLSLFPLNQLSHVRPVAAHDYFMANKWLAWFSLNVMNVIPIDRQPVDKQRSLFAPLIHALENNAILILFPEGTRGEPETMGELKNGVGHLLNACQKVPVVPVFFHGLGKCLPKGEFILVPFFVDVFVGKPLYWPGSRAEFMDKLRQAFAGLQSQATHLTDDL